MIVRYMNALAIAALVGSAGYAYSIKYETILYSEKIHKLEAANDKIRDQIRLLRAEYAHLARPERIQMLASKHLELQQLDLKQVGSLADLPEKPPKTDDIGRKLKALGLAAPTNTPRSRSSSGATRARATKTGPGARQ